MGEDGRQPYLQFMQAIKEAEGHAVTRWLEQIDAAAEAGSWQAAAWMLERRYPQEYGRRVVEQQHSGTVAHVGLHLWETRLQEVHTKMAAQKTQRALEAGHNGHVMHPEDGVLDLPRQGQ